MGVWVFACVWKQGRGQMRKKKEVTFCFTFSITKKIINRKTNTNKKTRCWLIRNLEVIHGTNDELAQERKKHRTDPRQSSSTLVHPFYLLIPPNVLVCHCFLGSGLKAEIFKKQKQILKNYTSSIHYKVTDDYNLFWAFIRKAKIHK